MPETQSPSIAGQWLHRKRDARPAQPDGPLAAREHGQHPARRAELRAPRLRGFSWKNSTPRGSEAGARWDVSHRNRLLISDVNMSFFTASLVSCSAHAGFTAAFRGAS